MTVALKSPNLIKALVSVDNAPVDAHLSSDFHRYVKGLQVVEEKRVQKQVEADDILTTYEKVCRCNTQCASYYSPDEQFR